MLFDLLSSQVRHSGGHTHRTGADPLPRHQHPGSSHQHSASGSASGSANGSAAGGSRRRTLATGLAGMAPLKTKESRSKESRSKEPRPAKEPKVRAKAGAERETLR